MEVILNGGRANRGNVVRIDDQVARPSHPQSASVDHFLKFLIQAGVDTVPEPFGLDDQGRRRFRYFEGSAPAPPYPDWAFSEDLMIEVAQGQRVLHQAAQGYEPPDGAEWATTAGDYFPDAALQSSELVVCHNDLGMSNVIVNESKHLVGFIDFDYVRPVDRLFDIAVAVRHWAPFGNLDIVDGPQLDRVHRFGAFCDVHELDADQRHRVVQLATSFLEQARRNITALAAAGNPGFQALLDGGYEQTNLATVAWLKDRHETLAAT